jgi:flagellar motor protein MotB
MLAAVRRLPVTLFALAGSAVAGGLTGCASAPPAPPPSAAAPADPNRELVGMLQDLKERDAEKDARIAELLGQLRNLQGEVSRVRSQPPAQDPAQAERLRQYELKIAELNGKLDELAKTPPPAPAPPPAAPAPARPAQIDPPAVAGAGPLAPLPELNAAVKELAAKNGLTYDERTGMLRLPGDMLFASGSDRITPEGQALLRKASAVLLRPELRDFRIEVIGHTDKRPIVQPKTLEKFPTNWHLSTARAVSVVGELINMARADGRTAKDVEAVKDRFKASGRGQRELLDNGDGESAHRKNRRVEVFFIPPGRIVSAR